MNPNEILEEIYPDLVWVHNNITENETEIVENDQNIFTIVLKTTKIWQKTMKTTQMMKK